MLSGDVEVDEASVDGKPRKPQDSLSYMAHLPLATLRSGETPRT